MDWFGQSGGTEVFGLWLSRDAIWAAQVSIPARISDLGIVFGVYALPECASLRCGMAHSVRPSNPAAD